MVKAFRWILAAVMLWTSLGTPLVGSVIAEEPAAPVLGDQPPADPYARAGLAEVSRAALPHLVALKDLYSASGKLKEAAEVNVLLQRLQQLTEVSTPVDLSFVRGNLGKSIVVQLRGSTSGAIWGTDVYTNDTDPATAAVHAGVLQPGELGRVRITSVEPLKSYQGSKRNGVESHWWGRWNAAYRIEPDDGTVKPAPAESTTPDDLRHLSREVGKSFVFQVTGSTTGFIWGSDVYTTDSKLGTAAVHAGILKEGEQGAVKATILPGQDSYEKTSRNGVTSHSYGSYDSSYRLEKP